MKLTDRGEMMLQGNISDEHASIIEWMMTLFDFDPELSDNFKRQSVEEEIEIAQNVFIAPDLVFISENKKCLIMDVKTCPPSSVISKTASIKSAIIPSFDYKKFSVGIKDAIEKYTSDEAKEYFLKEYGSEIIDLVFIIPYRCYIDYKLQIYDQLEADHGSEFSLWVLQPSVRVNITLNNHSNSLLINTKEFILPIERHIQIYLTRNSPRDVSTFFIMQKIIQIARSEGVRDYYTPQIIQNLNERKKPVFYSHITNDEFVTQRWQFALNKACDLGLMRFNREASTYEFREIKTGSPSSTFTKEYNRLLVGLFPKYSK